VLLAKLRHFAAPGTARGECQPGNLSSVGKTWQNPKSCSGLGVHIYQYFITVYRFYILKNHIFTTETPWWLPS
jgi:hypothetical protein